MGPDVLFLVEMKGTELCIMEELMELPAGAETDQQWKDPGHLTGVGYSS